MMKGTTDNAVRVFAAEDLYRATDYWFTIIAVNAIGDSLESDQAAVTTDSTAPFDPQNLDTDTVTDTSFRVYWTAPSDNGGEAIEAYNVWIKTTGETPPGSLDAPTYIVAGNVLTVLATGLTRATTYYVWVEAENSIGTSALTGFVMETTSTTPPSADLMFSAAAQSPSEIFLTWNAPSDNGGLAITAYIIRYGMSADNLMELATVSASTFTYSHGSLPKYTEYFYSIAAVNSDGESDTTTVVSATTFSTVPGSPALTVREIMTDSFIADWTAPADNGGKPITEYLIWLKEEESNIPTAADTPMSVAADIFTYTLTGLTRATSYTIFIAAVNADGRSASFVGASYTLETNPEVPVAPTDLVFTIERDSNQVINIARLAFQSDAESAELNGGAVITAYTLYVAAKGRTDYDNPLWEKTTIESGSADFAGKVFTFNGKEFHTELNQLWITASNVAGESEVSEIYNDAEWLCYKCDVCNVRCYGRNQNEDICPPINDPFCGL